MSDNSENFKLPEKGFVFWPIGTGDSTTIAVTNGIYAQVDLHHLGLADKDDEPHEPIVDRLVELLPKIGGKPYLTAFVLTHPDRDHCLGFAELLARVRIGELWFSPRIFREFKKDLCDDAVAFKEEATRRVKKTIADPLGVGTGDRVRIIGYDELLQEEDYRGFPPDRLTVPGNAVSVLDGVDQASAFRAFIHAPFKDDCDGERNDASIAMQITLRDAGADVKCLLLGDHCYPALRKIFDLSSEDDLRWNVLLAPHHCSKSAMYWCDDPEGETVLKQDILDSINGAQMSPGHIVASSNPIPIENQPGDNPPHAKAKSRYEEVASNGFVCTQEHPDRKNPRPVVFELAAGRLVLTKQDAKKSAATRVAAAIVAARGAEQPPRDRVGFGRLG